MKRRVVITSTGVVSSLGRSAADMMKSLKEKTVAFERQSYDRDVVAAPVKDFNVRSYTGPYKDGRYLNRGAQFAVASALNAARHSGVNGDFPAEAGIFVGAGPNLNIGGEFPDVACGNIDRADLQALWILKFLPNTAASVIASLLGIHGENLTVSTACSASLQAIGEAFRRVKDGYLDCALAGGGDSRLNPGGILAYSKAQALCNGDGDPQEASMPFDCGRSGFAPGEGGAFFLLEEVEAAKKRGAKIYGEICGYGCSLDGCNMTAPDTEGKSGKAAVIAALKEAELPSSQIDAVFAHGTGTVLNDEMEANLIFDLYGERRPPVTAIKSWIGHAASACGALELAVALACLEEGYLPEIRNLVKPCRSDVNFVRSGMTFNFGAVVIENFGFGGQNSALVIKKI